MEVLLVTHQDVDVLHYAAVDGDRLLLAAPDAPELRPVVEVEGNDRPGSLGRLHRLDYQFAGGARQSRKNPATVEPAHAFAEDPGPVEVPRFELGCRLVGPVVEHDRGPHAITAVAVDGRHVGTADTVVGKSLVDREDAFGAHPFGDEVADRVIDHGAHDGRLEPEAVGQVGSHVELGPARVDMARGGLAERDHPGVQTVVERSQGHEVQGGLRLDVQPIFHRSNSSLTADGPGLATAKSDGRRCACPGPSARHRTPASPWVSLVHGAIGDQVALRR